MKNVRNLNEQDIDRIVNRVLNEDLGDPFGGIKSVARGLKGVWRGEGYDYYKNLSLLLGLAQRLQSKAKGTDYLYNQMIQLKNKVGGSKMTDDKKDKIYNAIDLITNNIDELKNSLDNVTNAARTRFN